MWFISILSRRHRLGASVAACIWLADIFFHPLGEWIGSGSQWVASQKREFCLLTPQNKTDHRFIPGLLRYETHIYNNCSWRKRKCNRIPKSSNRLGRNLFCVRENFKQLPDFRMIKKVFVSPKTLKKSVFFFVTVPYHTRSDANVIRLLSLYSWCIGVKMLRAQG